MTDRPGQLRVVGIAGSARRGGNSDLLLDEALRGAEEEGGSVSRVVPAQLPLDPCRACDACRHTSRCAIDDLADSVHKDLSAADALVLATPVYFGGVPAQLKALIDRAQVRHWSWLARGSPPPQKPALLLVVGGRSRMQNAIASVRTVAASWFAVLGFKVWEVRGYAGLDSPTAILSSGETLREARELGRLVARTEAPGRRAH